ncbi:MAG: aldehyde dehydrogenase family protein [Acidimicrobiales bacterium]
MPGRRHPLRAAGRNLHVELSSALRAARELHFGAVLVNEVPTWRADQMPYGGVRESGNTKEGPAYAVRQMTEERLVVIKP